MLALDRGGLGVFAELPEGCQESAGRAPEKPPATLQHLAVDGTIQGIVIGAPGRGLGPKEGGGWGVGEEGGGVGPPSNSPSPPPPRDTD